MITALVIEADDRKLVNLVLHKGDELAFRKHYQRYTPPLLGFVTRLLAGTGGELTGLAVYEAELGATDSPRVFQFILTLTQNIRRASIISGKLRLDVEGTLDHRPVTLDWSQLTDGAPAEPSFRFKYFQQLEGYLTLPEHFSPTRLLVTLDVKDQRKPVSRAFDWQNLLDASAN